jgi:hypothetical protein
LKQPVLDARDGGVMRARVGLIQSADAPGGPMLAVVIDSPEGMAGLEMGWNEVVEASRAPTGGMVAPAAPCLRAAKHC